MTLYMSHRVINRPLVVSIIVCKIHLNRFIVMTYVRSDPLPMTDTRMLSPSAKLKVRHVTPCIKGMHIHVHIGITSSDVHGRGSCYDSKQTREC